MLLVIAYITVILIWSTTPLGITWSSSSISPSLALLLRMAIALILGLACIKLLKVRFPWHKNALLLYIYSAIGIAVGMFFTYLAAQMIPSGLISLIFGLSPILSGLFSQKLLKEQSFTLMKKSALVIAFFGLLVVCFDNLAITKDAWQGIVFILIAVVLFSLSGVLVKSVTINIHPLASTVGTLTVSMPCFILIWFILDGQLVMPDWQPKALWSVIYLGVFGSLIAFIAYFYVLKHLTASTVSLVTLITPVIAIMLGHQFNDEIVSQSLVIGTIFIITGLFLYLFGHHAIFNFKVNTMK